MNEFISKQIAALWVTDPTTGVDINVAPLLYFLRRFDSLPNTPISTGAHSIIELTLKTLNLTVHDPDAIKPEALVNLYHGLHMLKEMFNAIQERPVESEEMVNLAKP